MKDCSMARRTLFVRFIVLSAILFGLLSLTSCDMIEDLLATSDEPGTIYGYVVMEDGAARTNVSVTATNSDGTLTYSTTTDKNGYYIIEQVSPAKYTLSFKKTAYADSQKSITIRGGKNADAGTVTLYISYGYINGKVTDESGSPITGATVTVSGSGLSYSAKTDSTGKYSIKAKPGTYTAIMFNCTCWSTQYTLSDKITLSSGKNVKVSDYSLTAHHSFVAAGTDESTGNKINRCKVCGLEMPVTGAMWAGVRVSSYGMRSSFGKNNFPSETDMAYFGQKMSACYEGSTGAYVIIVGTISEIKDDNQNVIAGRCSLQFPLSKSITYATGSNNDFYESYLTSLDNAGYSVWLQVEPGDADLVELAKEVMNHYKHHQCVKGFGIDVEWFEYRRKANEEEGDSSKLSNTNAKAVVDAVRTINPEYTVFVKHWDEEWLPEASDGLVFINDSQGFHGNLNKMCSEFADWADNFYPCPVMFQIGYNADKDIWGEMENPAKELGEAILEKCTSNNDIGIIWVDFTLKEVIEKIPVAD